MESVKTFVNSRGKALREIFPHTSDLARELTHELRTRACLVPRRAENLKQAHLIGSAAEFAVGWHFGSSPEHMVARVAQCEPDGPLLGQMVHGYLAELRGLDAQLANKAGPLAVAFLLLAYGDSSYRSGTSLPDVLGLNGPERTNRGGLLHPASPMLGASLPMSLLLELKELLERSADFLGPPRPAVCNPAFVRIGIIDGADADLILDGTIVEVKVLGGAEPRIKPEFIWQLLSYAGLDWIGGVSADCGHDVNSVAVWELRRQFKWRASLDDVSRRIGGTDWNTSRKSLLGVMEVDV
jgi:hypothetical protein